MASLSIRAGGEARARADAARTRVLGSGRVFIRSTAEEGRDFAIYMKAAAILEELIDRSPRHPGALHYMIHAYDDPVPAPLGLRAARAYGEVAADAADALHMPSHIFFALGRWDDAIRVNEASWRASVERARRWPRLPPGQAHDRSAGGHRGDSRAAGRRCGDEPSCSGCGYRGLVRDFLLIAQEAD